MLESTKDRVNETVSGQVAILSEMIASFLQPVLDDHGIGFGTFDLLAAVYAADGKLSQAAIAKRMGISPASLTEAVKSSVKKGFVRQVNREGDMRAKNLVLSRPGLTLLNLCLARLEQIENMICADISASDLEITLRVLRQSIQNLMKIRPG